MTLAIEIIEVVLGKERGLGLVKIGERMRELNANLFWTHYTSSISSTQ